MKIIASSRHVLNLKDYFVKDFFYSKLDTQDKFIVSNVQKYMYKWVLKQTTCYNYTIIPKK